jgi:hypothetical protein
MTDVVPSLAVRATVCAPPVNVKEPHQVNESVDVKVRSDVPPSFTVQVIVVGPELLVKVKFTVRLEEYTV